jgi:hypothetical protein
VAASRLPEPAAGVAIEAAAWTDYAASVADWVAAVWQPRRVLDVGSSLDGRLAAELRLRGIAVDVWPPPLAGGAPADTARAGVSDPESARAAAAAPGPAPATERVPGTCDLAIAIESLTTLPAAARASALAAVCSRAEAWVLSASPIGLGWPADGAGEAWTGAPGAAESWTPDAWARRMATHGFLRDVDFDASPVTPWAAVFRRRRLDGSALADTVAAYERKLARLAAEGRVRRLYGVEQQAGIVARDTTIHALNLALETEVHRVAVLKGRFADNLTALARAEARADDLRSELSALTRWRADVEAGSGWRLVQRLQAVRAGLLPPGSRRAAWLARILGQGR